MGRLYRHIMMLALVVATTTLFAQQRTDTVIFSQQGGFYDESFNLTLSCSAHNRIRYTTDGSTPTAKSTLYEQPLFLDRTMFSGKNIYKIQISPSDLMFVPDSVKYAIVVRAAVFDDNDNCISETASNTYLIGDLGCISNGIAAASICADYDDLFDEQNGIFVPGVNWSAGDPEHTGNYYQSGKEWERKINFEFYEPSDNDGINQTCGLRTHGNRSRRYPAKGMKIYARNEYGKKRFKHQFFADSDIDSYKHLVLKPFASFWPYSGTQDYFCNTLARQIGLDAPNCRPIALYINGEYWGVYFIQEKMDDHYIEDHYGIDHDNVNIIGNWHGETENGTNYNFIDMMDWFRNADLTDDFEFQHACELIDIDNFTDYYVFQTFVANHDWPGNNMRCWQNGDGLWHWMFFDGDATIMESDFNVFANAAIYSDPETWGNYPDAKLVFSKLLENDTFKAKFRERAIELCKGHFLYENTKTIFDDIEQTLKPLIPNQKERFGYPDELWVWDYGNGLIDNFLENRVDIYCAALDNFNLLDNSITYEQEKFVCYPNPTRGQLNIKTLGDFPVTVTVKVYNLLGAMLHTESFNISLGQEIVSFSLDLPAGTYFVKIGNYVQRVIIY